MRRSLSGEPRRQEVTERGREEGAREEGGGAREEGAVSALSPSGYHTRSPSFIKVQNFCGKKRVCVLKYLDVEFLNQWS